MNRYKLTNHRGYSLFELIVVMIIISILMAVSTRYMGNSVDVSKTEETKEELDQLAFSIVGNEALISGSHRTDYGYVGDIGALPTTLSDLVTNPGFATWDGPYLKDDFYTSSGSVESEYLVDGWGKAYTYTGGTTINSTGGSTTITRTIANASSNLLYNSVSFNIVDLANCPPGTVDKDSVLFNLTYPNGLGSYQTISKSPFADGYISFDSIPIGQQTLAVIEMKNSDTLIRKIHVNPNSLFHSTVQLPVSIWCDTTAAGGGGGGITYVSGTAQTKSGNCDRIEFDITNTSGSSITLTNITVSWVSPTAFYRKVKYDGPTVVDQKNPQVASGELATFSNSQTITSGQTVTIRLDKFESSANGGSKVDMTNTDMTVTFSDGSVLTFNSGACN